MGRYIPFVMLIVKTTERGSNGNNTTQNEEQQAMEKIAVKCCKVTTVYIRSWIAEESTRVFIFGLSLNGFT